MKPLDPAWWRRTADGYEQQHGAAKLIRLQSRKRITGWSLYINGVCRGQWRSLEEAKGHAYDLTAAPGDLVEPAPGWEDRAVERWRRERKPGTGGTDA